MNDRFPVGRLIQLQADTASNAPAAAPSAPGSTTARSAFGRPRGASVSKIGQLIQ